MIIGIDYSISSPAITVKTDVNEILHFAFKQKKKQDCWSKKVTLLELPEWKTPEERYSKLCNTLLDAVLKLGTVEKAYIEAYAFGGSGMLLNIAEATSVMKQSLYELNIPIVTLAPTEIKKASTGKGNAKKGDMAKAFIEKTGEDIFSWFNIHQDLEKIPAPLTDIVDSYFVLQTGIQVNR